MEASSHADHHWMRLSNGCDRYAQALAQSGGAPARRSRPAPGGSACHGLPANRPAPAAAASGVSGSLPSSTIGGRASASSASSKMRFQCSSVMAVPAEADAPQLGIDDLLHLVAVLGLDFGDAEQRLQRLRIGAHWRSIEARWRSTRLGDTFLVCLPLPKGRLRRILPPPQTRVTQTSASGQRGRQQQCGRVAVEGFPCRRPRPRPR